MYRSVEIGGRKVRARGLTWGEVKALRADGHDPADLGEGSDEVLERVFGMALENPAEADDLLAGDAYRLFAEIMRLTYPGPEEKKG